MLKTGYYFATYITVVTYLIWTYVIIGHKIRTLPHISGNFGFLYLIL